AWLVLAWALLRRRYPIAIAAAFVAVCHFVWVVPSLVPEGSYDRSHPMLRVATANLLCVNRRRRELLRELEAIDADVLVLEEVSPAWWMDIEGSALMSRYPHREV